jgi:hypothetical protein
MHYPTDELPDLVALVLSVHGDTLVDCDRARDRKHAFHWPQRRDTEYRRLGEKSATGLD